MLRSIAAFIALASVLAVFLALMFWAASAGERMDVEWHTIRLDCRTIHRAEGCYASEFRTCNMGETCELARIGFREDGAVVWRRGAEIR